MGIIIPIMGTITANLSNALFSKVQQRVLAILYGQPNNSFHTNDIIRLTQSGTGAVQRELRKLAFAELVTIKSIGNQKHYQANSSAPIFSELRNIILKTFGLADVLREALTPLSSKIDVAFIYGSIARQEETANSDIDILLVGELSFSEAVIALYSAQEIVRRDINPKVYQRAEWKKLVKNKDAFIQEILKKQKIFIIGTLDDTK